MVRKLRKDEKRCLVCGAIFRSKNNRQNFCSKKCYKKYNGEQTAKYMKKKQSLGTPWTWNLSEREIKKQLYLIRNNIDNNKRRFSNNMSRREVILQNTSFNDLL